MSIRENANAKQKKANRPVEIALAFMIGSMKSQWKINRIILRGIMI